MGTLGECRALAQDASHPGTQAAAVKHLDTLESWRQTTRLRDHIRSIVYSHIATSLQDSHLYEKSTVPFDEYAKECPTSVSYQTMCSFLEAVIHNGDDEFTKGDWLHLRAHDSSFKEALSNAGLHSVQAWMAGVRKSRWDALESHTAPKAAEMWVSDICTIVSRVLDARGRTITSKRTLHE